MSDTTINLDPTLYTYMKKNSLREPEFLQQLREQTHKMSASRMQISPEQGQFMRLIVQLMGARKALEIGVFTGYSTLSVALGLPDDGKVIACDINVEWTKIAQKFWGLAGVQNKIDLRLAPALETLDHLIQQGEANTFDFAFIDADKLNYQRYYEKCLALIRPGGLILIDNVLWSGKVADLDINDKDTVAIRQLNAKLVKDDRICLSLLPIGDGLTLALKK